jgi:Fe2+ transport system protein B
MLRPNVKNYAESGNMRGLHYIFRDALDADPTFEDYLESYRYCENIPGFFEKHREITPFAGKDFWQSTTYWNQLKMDLTENFSRERYEHLRKVAQVYYAEKIRTIRREEEIERQKKKIAEAHRCVAQKNNTSQSIEAPVKAQGNSQKTAADKQRQEDERIAREIEELKKENLRVTSDQQNQDKKTEQRKKQLERENQETLRADHSRKGDICSKKWIGVAVAVVIVILAVVLLLQGNPGNPAAGTAQSGTALNALLKLLEGRSNA